MLEFTVKMPPALSEMALLVMVVALAQLNVLVPPAASAASSPASVQACTASNGAALTAGAGEPAGRADRAKPSPQRTRLSPTHKR